MKAFAKRRMVVAALAIPLALSLLAANSGARGSQEPADKPAAEKKERAKPQGRLPVYYAAVVSADQRRKIYEIQASYAEQMKKLQDELQALTVRCDGEVEAVLTPEQKGKVEQLRTEAAAKRKQSKQSKASPADSTTDQGANK